MTDTTIDSASPAATELPDDARIERWLAEATPDAAAQLTELARTTASKATRKAARRGLYLLGLRGIRPPEEHRAATVAPPVPQPAETLRAWASAYDGAGNRLFLLVLSRTDGGDATVAQILANDELGLRNLTVERKRLRDIAPLMDRLEGRIDEGLAVAEIEADYVRYLMDRFREINLQRSTTTPAGFLDLLPRLGTSTHNWDNSPVYNYMAAQEVPDAGSAPDDPSSLFALPWFEPWFFAAEDVAPWLERWMAADGSFAEAEDTSGDLKRSVAHEAASVLVHDRARALYISRLEESADVLRRRGRDFEARQALLHANALKSDAPAGDVPFAVALAARTLDAAAEMVLGARAENAPDGTV